MSEQAPPEYDPYQDPSIVEQANGDLIYLDLLAKENIAAASLFADCYDPAKLDHFTLRRDAVLAYEQYLKGQSASGPTSG